MAAKPKAAATSTAEKAKIGLHSLVARVYESAGHPERLAAFIRDTATHFAAQQSAIAIWNEDNPARFLPITFGINSEDLERRFAQRQESASLFARLDKLEAGQTIVGSDGARPILAGLASFGDENRCAIVLFRDDADSEFDVSDQAALITLIAYFERATAFNKQYIRLFVEHDAALGALEFAPRGIIFIARSGQIAYRNSAARMILEKSDGLREKQGSMHIDDPAAQDKFHAFIGSTISADSRNAPDSMICKAPRGSGAAAYQLIISRVPVNKNRASLNADEIAVMAIIHNPNDLVDLDAKFLRTFYELSPAEARLGQALYKHKNLASASKALGISINTARSELKRIFKKVGVNSQSALLVEFTKALKEM